MQGVDRFNDLQKQGFMRGIDAQSKQKRSKMAKPAVSCIGCMDWHVAGKHSVDRKTRSTRERDHLRWLKEHEQAKVVLGLT